MLAPALSCMQAAYLACDGSPVSVKLPSPVNCTGVQSYLATASRHKRRVGLVVWMDGIPSVLMISELPQTVRGGLSGRLVVAECLAAQSFFPPAAEVSD